MVHGTDCDFFVDFIMTSIVKFRTENDIYFWWLYEQLFRIKLTDDVVLSKIWYCDFSFHDNTHTIRRKERSDSDAKLNISCNTSYRQIGIKSSSMYLKGNDDHYIKYGSIRL